MHDPTDLILWAICIVIGWNILSSITGFEDWIKSLTGRKDSNQALEEQIKALDARVRELEKKP